MPGIRRTDSAVITTTGKEMNLDALRKAMIRIQEDICNRETDHRGDDCPSNSNRSSQGQNKRPVNRNGETYGPPAKINKPNSQESTSIGKTYFRGSRGQGRGFPRSIGNHRGSRNRPTARRAEYDGDGGYSGADEYVNDDEYEQNQSKTKYSSNNSFKGGSHIEFIAD